MELLEFQAGKLKPKLQCVTSIYSDGQQVEPLFTSRVLQVEPVINTKNGAPLTMTYFKDPIMNKMQKFVDMV